jgi:repressor LexA
VTELLQIKLKRLREERGISQAQLANDLGVRQSTVGMWESGKNRPQQSTLVMIANYFNVSVDYLINEDDIQNNSATKGVKIPVLGRVAAGVPITAVEEILGEEEITAHLAKTGDFFALQLKGSSMEPRMRDGDIVIVRQQEDVETGDIAIVMVNGDDATCKRVDKHKNGVSLISFNPSYPPKFYTDREVESLPVKIIGRVIELRAKF